MSDFHRILVTPDFSDQARPGVEQAAGLARKLGSELLLLFVVEDHLPPLLGGVTEDERQEILDKHRGHAAQKLTAYAAEHLADTKYETVAVVGVAPQEIVHHAEKHRADLIVMASRGYGPLRQLLLGSTAERVLHHAHCPVLLVPSK